MKYYSKWFTVYYYHSKIVFTVFDLNNDKRIIVQILVKI